MPVAWTQCSASDADAGRWGIRKRHGCWVRHPRARIDRRMSRGTTIMTGKGTMVGDSIDERTEWTESVVDEEEDEADKNRDGGAMHLYEREGEVV